MTITETVESNKERIARAFGVPAHLLADANRAAAPRFWSLCMISENHGTVGPAGCKFSHAPEKHERVLVVEVPASTRAPVAEFKGYVDNEPAVTWFDRDNMPRVGTKLFAAPIAAQTAQSAMPTQSWEAIGPVPVDRDENGWWSHPAIPNFDEDVDSYLAWVKAVGLEMKYKALESDPDHTLYDAWFENGECNASSWAPQEPAGDGWFTFSIHDSEDGPIWAWARRVDRAVAPALASGERQEGGRS